MNSSTYSLLQFLFLIYFLFFFNFANILPIRENHFQHQPLFTPFVGRPCRRAINYLKQAADAVGNLPAR